MGCPSPCAVLCIMCFFLFHFTFLMGKDYSSFDENLGLDNKGSSHYVVCFDVKLDLEPQFESE